MITENTHYLKNYTLDIEGSADNSVLILNKHILLGRGLQSHVLNMRETILNNYGFKKPLNRDLTWDKHKEILYAPTVDTTDELWHWNQKTIFIVEVI